MFIYSAMQTKKGTTSKSVERKTSGKKKASLVHAVGPECFWVMNGEILSNLLELRDALDHMTEDVFKYHVAKGRNDFADWVASVLKDRELGAALKKSRKPSTARIVIVRRLKAYNV